MSTRKIKDAKDLESNELIYFKGHAKATFMSDGRSVEDAIIKDVGEVNTKATQALNKATEAGENFNALEAIVNTKAGAFYVENETGLFIVFKDEESKSAYLTSGDESGFGLGLFIVKSIINIHNGSVSVESEYQKSTTFTVTLPK